MLINVFFLKKSKRLAGIFFTLLILICLILTGISYAQNMREEEMMKSIQIINPHSGFSLKLWLDKSTEATYTPGEKIKIFFQVSRDSFVTIYNYDTEGRVIAIFPDPNSIPSLIKAGEVRTIDGIIETTVQPGMEFIQGFATVRSTHTTILPKANKDYKLFTNQFKGIIQPLPPTEWVTSNLLSYMITPIVPPLNYSRISAMSNPPGAKVYLDNSYKGVTPLNLDNIASGQHNIKLLLSGYQEWNGYVSVFPSQIANVSVDLIAEQIYGSISISCNQSGAKIFIDGTYKKTTFSSNSVTLENIKEGYHELTIIKDGFRTWVEDIWVYFGEISSVDITMTKL